MSDDRVPLVTPEQISLLPKRYAIGKRPLSRLLGWGELTYTRLLEGRTPNKEHAEELRHLIDEPAAFARLLNQGRASGVITEMAYKRSRRALDDIIGEGHQGSVALFAVADRLCVLAEGDLTPRALQALMYFTQGWSIARLGEPLFDTLPRAASYGPEYPQIRETYSFEAIQAACTHVPKSDGDPQGLTDAASKLVSEVYQRYCDLSGTALCREARSQSPWRKARKRAGVPDGDDCDEPITMKSMKKFFAKRK